MLFTRIHRVMHEDEAGQTLVLGAISMLILALSVVVTVQLGHTIHKRMRLQDGADAAAYSQAAIAARSLNAIAFTNRTIVAHYVSIMGAQSILSHAYGFRATLELLALGVANVSALSCIIGSLFPPAAAPLQAFSQITSTVSTVIEKLATIADAVIEGLHLAVAGYTLALSELNHLGMHEATDYFRRQAAWSLFDTSEDGVARRMIRDNCSYNGSGCSTSGGANSGYGLFMRKAAWDYVAMFGMLGPVASALPGTPTLPKTNSYWNDRNENRDDSWQSAERLMAEVSNASRTKTESNRKFGWPPPLDTLLGWMIDSKTKGTTKFTRPMTKTQFKDKGKNYLFLTGEFTSQFSRGPAIVSTERAGLDGLLGKVLIWGKDKELNVGVHTAPDDQGYHCEWGGAKKKRILPWCKKIQIPKPPKCENDPKSHYAPGALSKYTAFEPLNDSSYGKLFNQRMFWGLAHLTAQEAQFPLDMGFGFKRSGNFTWDQWGNASTSAQRMQPGGQAFTKGLHAWARARVYYHRPGYWGEPPNLFNPFWRAKLSPINWSGSQAEIIAAAVAGNITEAGPAAWRLLQH